MRLVLDLEATGLLDESSIDYSTFPYKLRPTFKVHCICLKNLDTGGTKSLYGKNIRKIRRILAKATEIIFHNGLDYDMPVLELACGLSWKVGADGVDYVEGRPVKLTDTIVWSRLLWPDRPGGHGLKAWGERTGTHKGDYNGGFETFTPEMLKYCEGDVLATEAAYYALMEEKGDHPWDDAYEVEKFTAWCVGRYRHLGFKFDSELAHWCLDDLDTKMAEIEREVEPKLPRKELGKTDLKNVTPPVKQVNADGSPSKHVINFAERHGGRAFLNARGEAVMQIGDEIFPLPHCEPLQTHRSMKLADQKDIKEWLITLGWEPTVWEEKDLWYNSKKKRVSQQEYEKKVQRYIEDRKDSPFLPFVLRHVEVENEEQLLEKLLSRKRGKVITSPKFVKNQEKELCDNLVALGEQYDFIADIVRWMTYRHRRNAIEGAADTGFLSYVRSDGRIPTPANTCGCNTSRFQHSVVVNVPRPSSLYGEFMRALFGVDHIQLGYDFSSLEARIQAHYIFRFNGEELAKALIAEKPNDIHTLNAKKLGISRDHAKNISYACMPEHTEILTASGWKPLSGALVGDRVFSYHRGADEIRLDTVLFTFASDEADVFAIRGKGFEIQATEDHRWVGINPAGEGVEFTTSEIMPGYGILAGRDIYHIVESVNLIGQRDVFCVETQNQTFIFRQNGVIGITGNCIYGAQPFKLSKMLGCTLEQAKRLFDEFWGSMAPLARLRDAVLRFVEKYDYVRGIDQRKMWIRSPHSALNTLFQSAGVICAKRTNMIHLRKLEEENLLFDPFKDDTMRGKAAPIILYHDEVQIECWDEEIGERVGQLAQEAATETTEYYGLKVPLAVDYEMGKNWKECH